MSSFKGEAIAKKFPTHITNKRFMTCMDPVVSLQIRSPGEGFTACNTNVAFMTGVRGLSLFKLLTVQATDCSEGCTTQNVVTRMLADFACTHFMIAVTMVNSMNITFDRINCFSL